MPDAPQSYQRLPGSGGGGFQRCRLWLGSDHLLQVASTALGERYKRFYFADIQALILRRSRAGLAWSLVWLAFAALFGGFIFAVDEAGSKAALATCAGICFVLFLLMLWLGRSCICTVRTAVQTEELPSLRRLGTARKVLARVRPLIEASQTAVVPVEPATTPVETP